MKRKTINAGAILMALMITLVSLFSSVSAYERNGHDTLMLKILFGTTSRIENVRSKNEIKAIESACYLAIDQFSNNNGINGKKDYQFLLDYPIYNIPSEISLINIDATPNEHRNLTHLGWDHTTYNSKDLEKWLLRKQVLVSTVGTIFDFNGDENKQNSFSAILYYIHILGDHLDDKSYLVKNGQKMEIGGRHDKEDVIDELIKHTKILFEGQKSSYKYSALMNCYEIYNSQFSELVNSEGGINNDEKFQIKIDLANDFIKVLSYYLPEILQEESFFNSVFP